MPAAQKHALPWARRPSDLRRQAPDPRLSSAGCGVALQQPEWNYRCEKWPAKVHLFNMSVNKITAQCQNSKPLQTNFQKSLSTLRQKSRE